MNGYSHTEAEEIVHQTVKECRRVLRLKKNELRPLKPFGVIVFPDNFGSTGSQRAINIGLDKLKQAAPFGTLFAEYKRISNDPVIGGIISNDWRDAVRAVTCHEVAHTAQQQYYWTSNIPPRPVAKRTQTGHGGAWQYIYRLLRREIVNPLLPENAICNITCDWRNEKLSKLKVTA